MLAGFALSLLTPLAIKLGLPDVSKAGRVAGLIFALSTLGAIGNYLTGFYLMRTFSIELVVHRRRLAARPGGVGAWWGLSPGTRRRPGGTAAPPD